MTPLLEQDGPRRGDPHYRVYCPTCNREGIFAGWRWLLTGELISPEQFRCPECGTKVEVLGRVDQ